MTANTTASPGQLRAAPTWLTVLSRFWVWVFLILLLIVFTLGNPAFFSVANAMNVLTTAGPILLLALGQTFVIIASGIDMSVGWTMGLASVVAAQVMKYIFDSHILPPVPAILVGSAIGIAVTIIPGLINGLLIAKAKVPPFIATLGMYNIARGAALLISGGNTVAGLPPGISEMGNGNFMYILHNNFYFFSQPEGLAREDLREILKIFPFPVIVTLAITLICAFVLSRTRFGRRTYAIGGGENMQASIRAGIPVQLHLIRIYVLSSILAGVAGVLYTMRFTGGSYQAGEANLLDSVAAVVIGGASMYGGTGNIGGTVVGAILIAVLTTGLVILNVPPFWQFVAVGCVVIMAVLIDQAWVLIERSNKR